MKYIQLIVTGHLEKKALAGSLCKVFDSLLPTTGGERYEWLPAEKINGATGFPLPDLVAGQPHKSMEAMANKMLAALEPGKDRQRQPDLIMLIDDVELGNLGRESVLADHFKAALQSLVQKNSRCNPMPTGFLPRYGQNARFMSSKPCRRRISLPTPIWQTTVRQSLRPNGKEIRLPT